MIGLVDALNYMHKHDIYHQDIKPNNIIVSLENNCPKLVDFGLAVNQVDKENSNTIIGTYSYMPPEKFERKGTPKMHDIYALGVVFYEILTGRMAHPGKNITDVVDHIFHEKVEFREEDNVDQELQNICLKCVEKDPKDRYQNLTELYNALIQYSGNSTEINDYPYLSMVVDDKKMIFPLTNKINFLGRTFANHIVIPDIAISRSQAIIEVSNKVRIKNLSEVNNIQVGKNTLGFDEEIELLGHETIQIANYTFHFIPRAEIFTCKDGPSWGEETVSGKSISQEAQSVEAQVVESQIDNNMWERTITTTEGLNDRLSKTQPGNISVENSQMKELIKQLKATIAKFENK